MGNSDISSTNWEPKIPRSLSEAVSERRLIPFVGLGFPVSTGLVPSLSHFMHNAEARLRDELEERGATGVKAAMARGARHEAMQTAKRAMGGLWPRFLKSQFDPSIPEGTRLELFSAVWTLGSTLIITTNLDTLLESASPTIAQSWRIATGPTGTVVAPHDLNQNTVWHIQGIIDDPLQTILTDDGDLLIADDSRIFTLWSEVKVTLQKLARTHTFLFLGSSVPLYWRKNFLAGSEGPHYFLTSEGQRESAERILEDRQLPIKAVTCPEWNDQARFLASLATHVTEALPRTFIDMAQKEQLSKSDVTSARVITNGLASVIDENRQAPSAHRTDGVQDRTDPSPIKHDSERFGDWLLTGGSLGRGGQGEVVPVRHARTFERGALKRMVGKRALTEKGRERFLREIEAFRRIEHPFVVKVLDAGETPEPFLVTEVATFGSLHENLVAIRGDAWRALRLVRSIALGLASAHAKTIVHRDIKPKNILLQSLDHPLVADFGIAHFADKETITSIGSHPGAFKFAPPEYEYDEEPTPAFDVFSLGAVLHFALTGGEQKRPYRVLDELPAVGGSGDAAKRLHAVDNLISRMTKKDHAERFQTMDDVTSAIDVVAEKLFGRASAGPTVCGCEAGSFRDVGAVMLGRDTEIFVKPDDGLEEFSLPQVSPRLEMCSSCGVLRLRAAQPPPHKA